MLVDVAINPFGADVGEMIELARWAEGAPVDGVWVADHFSGAVVDRPWSRDPFVCLGAFAASTERVRLGVLVANIVNRHPAQLACAINSVQSLAPTRVSLGLGSGAAPGSRFAIEHEAIGRRIEDDASRRRALADYVRSIRSIWAGSPTFAAGDASYTGLTGVVDGASVPRIVIGASALPTIEVALEVADGVNIRRTGRLPDLLAALGSAERDRQSGFEVSVLEGIDDVAPFVVDELRAGGVDRLIVGVSAPFDRSALERCVALAAP